MNTRLVVLALFVLLLAACQPVTANPQLLGLRCKKRRR